MIREAIVLAGGLGTRLKSVVPDLPKCLAPVNDRPFLEYLLTCLRKQGLARFIFAVGYKRELVESFIRDSLLPAEYAFSIEQEPLGTGGAVYQACQQIQGTETLVINADTFFGLDLDQLSTFHQNKNADCTLALKPMDRFERYGAVVQNEQQQITAFHEKQFVEKGLINGGVYALHVASFISKSFSPVFSFEKDYLEKEYPYGKIYGMVSDAWFIDIGIPEDYQRAQTELIQHINDGI